MAKIKFDPSATPLNKEHYGFTFQRNNYGFSMFPAGKNDRKRYGLQWEKMQFMSKAIRNWRNMSAATKNAWNVFATTYPQPTEKDPNVFLTGYQLFLKRNFYRFLHEGINFDFMLSPELAELPTPDFSIEILEDGMCVDVTEEYIRNHGILPEVGQFVICRVIPIATNSGQFFAPFIATLEVQEVYIDGLVCSFNFPNVVENIVFSLYMSKPVYESVQYAGTKFRYMGCFKPTKFIQLTDTPESYEGQAGKVPKVNEEETGLIFDDSAGCEVCPPVPTEADAGKVITVNPAGDGYELAEGGGGSFDCADLLDCSIIQQILNSLSDIGEIVSEEFNTSIPPVNFGLLYNMYAFMNPKGISSSPDWIIPSRQDWTDFVTWIADPGKEGNYVNDPNPLYWNNPNPNWTNSLKLNIRGAGIRQISGLYDNLTFNNYIVSSTTRFTTNKAHRYSSGILETFNEGNTNFNIGNSVRLIRKGVTAPDGTAGTYTGNNGRIYRTIVWNGVEYLADALAETKYRDGSDIPELPVNDDWRYDTNGALAPPNGDWNNV